MSLPVGNYVLCNQLPTSQDYGSSNIVTWFHCPVSGIQTFTESDFTTATDFNLTGNYLYCNASFTNWTESGTPVTGCSENQGVISADGQYFVDTFLEESSNNDIYYFPAMDYDTYLEMTSFAILSFVIAFGVKSLRIIMNDR